MGLSRHVIAVDVGGTKIAAAVVDSGGDIVSRIRQPTDRRGGEAVAAQIAELTRKVLEQAGVAWDDIAAVGVDVPGIYFAGTGEVWAPNLPGWDRIPLLAILQAALPCPVVIDSDRAACVLGEQWCGAARGLTDVVFLTIGTGIGAGIITGGRLCRGAQGIAGAAGWLALTPQSSDLYRQVGCFEAEAAGPAVARRAAAVAAKRPTRMLELAGGCLELITPETVVEAARRGDAAAQEVLAETGRYLGLGLANLVSLLNPQMIVLGGGLMAGAEWLLEPARREMMVWAQPVAAQTVRVVLSELGSDAALLGAARLALEPDLCQQNDT
ncbi:MAG TPA: ROK family protein [Bryobacteraceae bacterium]|nr:ROK family protein [Bryobacteraceae bacterium]